MKIGIVSDTHRNTNLLQTVAKWLIHKKHIASLYHLGDDYDDVLEIADTGIDVVQVPGIYDKRYIDKSLQAVQTENILGLRVFLVHSLEKDASEEDQSCSDIILSGHTHKSEIIIRDGKLFLNPGHLKASLDKHNPASFGLLDIQDKVVHASIFNLDFKEIETIELMRSEMGLYKT